MNERPCLAARMLVVWTCMAAAFPGCTVPGGDAGDKSLEARLERIEGLLPGPGEVMSGIQVHFAKLRFAGDAGNWKLAHFELDEIEENLQRVATLRPAENGVNLKGLVAAFETTELADLSSAIEASDPKRFEKSYTEAIEMCNGCHRETGRPFIVITAPTSPPVPNQRWAQPEDPAGD